MMRSTILLIVLGVAAHADTVILRNGRGEGAVVGTDRNPHGVAVRRVVLAAEPAANQLEAGHIFRRGPRR
jgi:hypothetical protein